MGDAIIHKTYSVTLMKTDYDQYQGIASEKRKGQSSLKKSKDDLYIPKINNSELAWHLPAPMSNQFINDTFLATLEINMLKNLSCKVI